MEDWNKQRMLRIEVFVKALGAYTLEEFQLYGSDGTRLLWPLVQNFRNDVTVISFFRFQTNENAVVGNINQLNIGE